MHVEGPSTDPKDLRPALQRALAVVKSGAPALVDGRVEEARMKFNLVKIVELGPALMMSVVALAQDAPKGSADAGKVTFNKTCYTCHGTTGQGAETGPRIRPTALAFDAFIHQVRRPAREMVPIPSTILSDQDVADIYAYLQTQKREDYRQIPLLSQSR